MRPTSPRGREAGTRAGCEGADDALLASGRGEELAAQVRGRDPRRLREAAERCEDVRQALELNVAEDLALSALGFRLGALVGSPA